MAIQIRAVTRAEGMEAVYRFRYGVYVEELGRYQRWANHERKIIEEPLDAWSLLWGAYDGERLVGTVRTNYLRDGDVEQYRELYEMSRVGLALDFGSITTKLVVAPGYRSSALAYRLAARAYRKALDDGILFDFIDVYPERVPFFERLGYRVHVPEVVHPEYGAVVVMRIATRDLEHLLRVQSPLERHYRVWSSSRQQPCSPLSGGVHGSV